MKKAFIFIMIVLCGSARAQDNDGPPSGSKPDTIWIDLAGPPGPVSHSKYDRLEVLDERADSCVIGWLGNGTYYGLQLCLKDPLEQQLRRMMTQLTDSTADTGRLVMVMKQFVVYDNDGYCASLKFRLFAGDSKYYRELEDVDTTLRLPAGGRGRRRAIVALNGGLSAILSRALRESPDTTGDLFGRGVIIYEDQILKSKLPLYREGTYPDGVYVTFNGLRQLKPDYTRMIVRDTVNPEHNDILAGTRGDPSMLIQANQVYAFVFRGNAYVSDGQEFRRLTRQNGDLYITGKIRADAPGLDVSASLAGFLLTMATMGRLPLVQVWGLTAKKKCLFQVDYRTGKLIPVRLLE